MREPGSLQSMKSSTFSEPLLKKTYQTQASYPATQSTIPAPEGSHRQAFPLHVRAHAARLSPMKGSGN